MTEENESNVHYIPPPSGPGLKIPILFGVVIALIAANVYLFLQLDQVKTQMAAMQDSLLDEVSDLRETSTVTNQTQQRRLETMREELEAARRQAAMARRPNGLSNLPGSSRRSSSGSARSRRRQRRS